jgi:hypothetical protein
MRIRTVNTCALLLLGLATSTAVAQPNDDGIPLSSDPAPTRSSVASEPPVLQYNLSGPRVGATFGQDGSMRTQFGWHVENQAAPGSRGPWFLVERIFLIGGVEQSQFIPSGTLIFGVRTPSSAEFGIGPSVTISQYGLTSAIVLAAGHSANFGGIRVPVNVAVALSQRDKVTGVRVTMITGWAIKQPSEPMATPYHNGLEQ